VLTVRADVALVIKDPEAYISDGGATEQVVSYFQTLVQRLKLFSEAEATVASLLRNVQEIPLGGLGGLNPDKLDRAAEKASRLAATAQALQATLGDRDKGPFEGGMKFEILGQKVQINIGEGDKKVTQAELATAANELDGALRECEETVDDWQADLDASRAELPHLKGRILGWLTLAAFAVTAVCAWVGLSQIHLCGRAWKWCRGR
jgi:hypothetical protein